MRFIFFPRLLVRGPLIHYLLGLALWKTGDLDGAAAALLARRLDVPFTVTLRGTATKYISDPRRAAWMRRTVHRAGAVIAVSESLGRTARALGCPEDKIRVIPNGVDPDRFRPGDRAALRTALGLPPDAPVLLTVGSLVERKGFHRVIALLPELRARHPGLLYLVVGGPSAEGNYAQELREQVRSLGLEETVRFEGPKGPEELPAYYGAADLFVLATGNEGWCNGLMESLACGTPVVTTDVGGNRVIVTSEKVGRVVPFGDHHALLSAVDQALKTEWDRHAVRERVRACRWEDVARRVVDLFTEILEDATRKEGPTRHTGTNAAAHTPEGG